jgi:hypothetical protein
VFQLAYQGKSFGNTSVYVISYDVLYSGQSLDGEGITKSDKKKVVFF